MTDRDIETLRATLADYEKDASAYRNFKFIKNVAEPAFEALERIKSRLERAEANCLPELAEGWIIDEIYAPSGPHNLNWEFRLLCMKGPRRGSRGYGAGETLREAAEAAIADADMGRQP